MYSEETELLGHIREELDFIIEHSYEIEFYEFRRNPVLVRAIIRSLEIIGEASKKMPDNIRQQNPTIPWKSMAGLRDKLIHDYFGVDLEIVWDVIKNKIPELRVQIVDMLPK